MARRGQPESPHKGTDAGEAVGAVAGQVGRVVRERLGAGPVPATTTALLPLVRGPCAKFAEGSRVPTLTPLGNRNRLPDSE